MNLFWERLQNGIFKENPTFVLAIGMCPTLAVTSSATNGVGMGLAATAVLLGSNAVIGALRKVIPDEIRIPSFIVIIAGFVTLIQFFMQAWAPGLDTSLGIFIPLIVVNCIILGRAEAYASKNPVLPSLWDALGMGLGFTLALTLLGSIREILGAGSLFGFAVLPSSYEPALIMVLAPGAFLALGIVMGLINYRALRKKRKTLRIPSCGSDCSSCPSKKDNS
jgi:electron transport complex protein RnfE